MVFRGGGVLAFHLLRLVAYHPRQCQHPIPSGEPQSVTIQIKSYR